MTIRSTNLNFSQEEVTFTCETDCNHQSLLRNNMFLIKVISKIFQERLVFQIVTDFKLMLSCLLNLKIFHAEIDQPC